MEIKNALITGVSLDIYHGCLTSWVYLDYGDSTGQGFGGICLYTPDYRGMEPEGQNYAGKYLHKLLTVLGAEKFEKLKGMNCRAKIGDDGTVIALGHILKDNWFDPTEREPVYINSTSRLALGVKKIGVPLADGRIIELYDDVTL